MEFEINREALLSALSSLVELNRYRIDEYLDEKGKLVKNKVTFSEVRVDLCDNALSLSAISSYVAAAKSIAIVPSLSSTLTCRGGIVDTELFLKVADNKSLGKTLVLSIEDEVLLITSPKLKGTEFTIAWKDDEGASSFPVIPDSSLVPSINAQALRKLIENVEWAKGKRKDPDYLQGVYLHTKDDKLISVAMNGPRLARYGVEKPEGLELEDGVTIPKDSIPHILKFLEGVGDLFSVKICVGDNRLVLFSQDGKLVSSLLSSKFPEYGRLIEDKEYPNTIDYSEFIGVLDSCFPVADRKDPFAVIRHVEGEEGLAVEAWDGKGASAQCFVSMDGPDLPTHIGFNIKFMIEALSGGRDVKVNWGDGVKPIRIQGEHDTEYKAIITPMRVGLPVGETL